MQTGWKRQAWIRSLELAQRPAENLHAKMKEVNDQKKLVRAVPAPFVVEAWVAQAEELPRAVSY